MQSKHCDFWKQVRSITKSAKGSTSNSHAVDGHANDADISNAFASKLHSLLNSGNSTEARSEMLSVIEDYLSSSDLTESLITTSVVSEALSHLNAGKSDGTQFLSDHFLCISFSLDDCLSRIFTAMLRHGYVPNSLRDCVLQPIIKPGKDPTDSDSYRAIALAPTLSKVFEWCILIQYKFAFDTSDLQFGFKPGLSTDLCTGLIKNVIARYNFK